MSTTTFKRSLLRARQDAETFRALFPEATYEQWHFGGSVRRCREQVGDVEHIVIPLWGDIELAGGLFPETKRVNLLMHRLDELVGGPTGVKKHLYGGQQLDGSITPTKFKWGDKSRGVDFRDFCHEIYTADADNLGSVLAIRTGPGGYSKMLVNALQRNGYCNQDGYVWNKNDITCSECGWHGTFTGLQFIAPADWPYSTPPKFVNGREHAGVCPTCASPNGLAMARVPAPDEPTYFKLCGLGYVAPAARIDPLA